MMETTSKEFPTTIPRDLSQENHESSDKYYSTKDASDDKISSTQKLDFYARGKFVPLYFPRSLFPIKSQAKFDDLYESSEELQTLVANWEAKSVPYLEAKETLEKHEAAVKQHEELLQRDLISKSVAAVSLNFRNHKLSPDKC